VAKLNPTQSYVSPWVYPIISKTNRFILQHVFFKSILVQGQAHLPAQGPAVLAIKHYSRWDPLVIAQLQPDAVRFMTNANQFSGLQGWFLMRLGAFAIDLARPQKSSIKHMIELLHQDEIVGIFPEGGIVRDKPLRSLKPGLARLILQAESSAEQPRAIPIIPIALHYAPEAQFGASVCVDISPPFTSQKFSVSGASDKQKAAQITEHLEAVLRDRLAHLRRQSAQKVRPER
jgi:1-acyl-sn-glycerol-3-phosphate acyltransferase